MSSTPDSMRPSGPTRRTFLHSSGAIAGAGLGAGSLLSQDVGRARGSEELGVALVGCGGRGTGAAGQARLKISSTST